MPRKTLWNGLAVLSCGLLGILRADQPHPAPTAVVETAIDRDDEEDDEEDGRRLEAGLTAVYRSLDPSLTDATLVRIDAKPALAIGAASPHPRIPPGPFEVAWDGVLEQTGDSPVRFGGYVGGSVTVTLDGAVVFEAASDRQDRWIEASAPVPCSFGGHDVRIVYRSTAGVPARLQLWWMGEDFSWEPLPAWRWKHVADSTPRQLIADEMVGRGRDLAGAFGCGRCHAAALPAVDDPAPGPVLAGSRGRLDPAWLAAWLGDPHALRPGTPMPALFEAGRQGEVERWIVADHLARSEGRPSTAEPGDVRAGEKAFLSLGCMACHPTPDALREESPRHGQRALRSIADRMTPADLAGFLVDPHARYPDGRMPLAVDDRAARDLAAFILVNTEPPTRPAAPGRPRPEELEAVVRRLHVADGPSAAVALIREKRCAACHEGLEDGAAPRFEPVPLVVTTTANGAGCLAGTTGPRFALDPEARRAIAAYVEVAPRERHASAPESRRRALVRSGCAQCHVRDGEGLSMLDQMAAEVGDKDLRTMARQRVPTLAQACLKFQRTFLTQTIREGVTSPRTTFVMPAFGAATDRIIQALAEADGDLVDAPEAVAPEVKDPEFATHGPALVGPAGYSCINCHLWKGRHIAEPEPGSAGPELTSVTTRIRRDYFDRWLEGPARLQPRTPMPRIFRKGHPAALAHILDGDPRRQQDALWAYLSKGEACADPKSLPPTPLPTPAPGQAPLVAQIPLHLALPDAPLVEAILAMFPSHDALVYDVQAASCARLFTGARLERVPTSRRLFALVGRPVGGGMAAERPVRLVGPQRDVPTATRLAGYDRLADGVRIRTVAEFPSGPVSIAQTFRLAEGAARGLECAIEVAGVPADHEVEFAWRDPHGGADFTTKVSTRGGIVLPLPPEESAPPPPAGVVDASPAPARGAIDGASRRPGYRALAYPRPKTPFGEDLLMPGAIAVNPRDGRVYVSSMKQGHLFRIDDPRDTVVDAEFVDAGGGLFQDAYSMVHDGDAIHLLHRRNLTRLADTDGDGVFDRFDREALLEQPVMDNVDNAYGLVREPSGSYVFTFTSQTRKRHPGYGGAVRLVPGAPGTPGALEELCVGLRRAYGWAADRDGEIFFTDQQGEWVATNCVRHVGKGLSYGYPNNGQDHHLTLPRAKTAVWVPYSWSLSTTGLVYADTGGRFGPFDGQFFTAGWFDKQGVIRIQLEHVDGVWQGAAIPFWGPGMLGPLTLAFDTRGRLLVGGITDGSCGARPDRGAVFRVEYTGEMPFEMRSLHPRRAGFRVVFTKPVDPVTAADPTSYRLEHYRYEYTKEYGSPELDRTALPVQRAVVAADGLSVELHTSPLVVDRVVMVRATGVRSADGENLVHPEAAYTLNALPAR
jgi:mono/diheme cytochrome c family protein